MQHLTLLLRHKVLPHPLTFFGIVKPLHGRTEKAQTQHYEYHEQLEQNYQPQCAAPSHLSEAIVVKRPNATQYVCQSVHVANICK